jgi:hypothetical protein
MSKAAQHKIIDACDDDYFMSAELEVTVGRKTIDLDLHLQCPTQNHIKLYPAAVDQLIEFLQEAKKKFDA